MASEKRSFPYYSAVPEISIKRRAVEVHNPGQKSGPADVFELPDLDDLDPSDTPAASDFTKWSDSDIKGFLDKRGEDYDDCQTRVQLVRRAVQCEFTTGPAKQPAPDTTEGEGDDPLDAFMLEMQQLVDEQKKEPQDQGKPGKADLEDEEDNVADFMEARRQNGRGGLSYVAEGYNSDDEVYATDKAMQQAQGDGEEAPQGRQQIGPLPALDHDDIAYQPFAKDFYTPVHKIASMTPAEVNAMRRQLAIRVSGFDAPAPVESFEQCGLDVPMLAVLKGMKYQSPTAIQAQALPAALSGRDVLGIAKTGSGKTAAFLIPMFVHIQDQPELEKGEGPIGVVAAPTRELAEQIHKEARKFGKPYGMRIAAGIGGLSKFEQFKDLKSGADAMVCTPGRLIDLIKMKGCTLRRTTYIVFDEADRMFDMGFEPQVRSIIGQIRPDRQTLLFSATMPTKVERLVRDALTSPVRISVGEIGAANEDIKQVVSIVPEAKKVEWLLTRLPEMIDSGEVLVFANQIVRVEEVTEKIKALGHRVIAIHGDMSQHSRTQALKDFSAGRQHTLVATDVAARGLDIKSIKNVVNLDAAKDIDTHVHRVGRTGRAGDKEGTAHTLLTPKQSYFAGLLLNSMAAANQEITPELQALAMKDPRFSKGQTRSKGGKGNPGGGKRRQQVGGAGIGFGNSQDKDDTMQTLYGDRSEFTKGADLGGSSMAAPLPPGAATALEAPRNSILGGPPKQAPQQLKSAEALLPPLLKHQQPKPEGPADGAGGGVFGGQGFKGIMQNRFKSQFVASGTAGGDIGQKATIIAAKVSKPTQEAPPAPSFLAKKLAPLAADQASAQQAIAAAKVIAARLAGGAQPSEPLVAAPHMQPPRNFLSNSSSGRSQPPLGYGSSASAYPDLSEDRGGEREGRYSDDRSSGREERDRGRSHEADRSATSTSRYSDRGPPANPGPPHGRYGGGSSGGGGMGSSASAYPDLSRDRERSRGSGFSEEGSAPSHVSRFGAPGSGFGAAPAASYPAAPPQVPQASATLSVPQSYGGNVQYPPPTYAQPTPAQPTPGRGANLQASIAAAQAIAARLSAQAGSAQPPLPGGAPPPRLGGVGSSGPPPGSQDSVAATIAAAKAIAARMGSGGGSVLNNQAPSSGGQWAWGKG